MVVCDETCVRHICKYLDISDKSISTDKNGDVTARVRNLARSSDETVKGFASVVLSLAHSQDRSLLGKSPLEEALVRQWVEYATCYANHVDVPAVGAQVLKELNDTLESRSYLATEQPTLADRILYYILYNTMAKLSFLEKEQLWHVSRWFNSLQQEERLRQDRKLLPFSRTPLYLSSSQ